MKNIRFVIITTLIIGSINISMTNANTFNRDHQLETQGNSELSNKVSKFWLTGVFSSFQGVANKRINYASFISNTTRSCLVISLGRSESYLKYKELISDLSVADINIFILDHRGQGLSERLLQNSHKGYVESFDDYADDLHTFITTIVKSNCPLNEKPLLLAHSMGGSIATRLMQKYPDTIKAALFSAPMIAINKGGLPDFIASIFTNSLVFINNIVSDQAWYFIGQSNYQAQSFSDNRLTHSASRYQKFIDLYQEMPQLRLGGITIQWLQQAFNAQTDIFAQLNLIKAPITIMQAGADTIVDNQAQNDFCQQLYDVNASLCHQGKPYVINGAKHELFFEKDNYRDQALEYTMNWITNFRSN